MKEIKKETRIIVGVSITLVLIAIIVTVVVLALKSVKRGTQILNQEYVYVENDGGVVTMRDGLFIAAVDGGYVLVREDKILSKKYSDLRVVDEEKMICEFSSYDGNYGRIDRNGDEIYSVKSNGNFIADMAESTDFEYCIGFDGGKQYAQIGEDKSKSYDRIFKHSETENFIAEIGNGGINSEDLPSGVFFAKDGESFYLANVYNENFLSFDEITLEKLSYDFVTVSGAEGIKTYGLPALNRVEELDAVSGENIFGFSGNLFYYGSGVVKRVGGASFGISFLPEKVVAADDNKVLLYGGGDGAYYAGGTVCEGRFEDLGVIWRVGEKLIYKSDLTAAGLETDSLYRVDTDGKIFFFAGPANMGTRALYEYKDGELILRSDAARTTYERPEFESERFAGEYETYFIFDDKIYDTDFSVVASGNGIEIVRKNLIFKDGIYCDIKGNNEVSGAVGFYDVYDFERDMLDEYLYKKADGLYTVKDKLYSSEDFDFNIKSVFKAESGTYVYVTDSGIRCVGSEISYTEFDDCVFMKNSNIALINGSQVRVVKATKRGFENVSQYGFFGVKLSEDYKKDETSATDGKITFGKICQGGVVFESGNGKQGLVDSDGRLALSPVYDKICLTPYYAIVYNEGFGADGGRYAVAALGGRLVTNFDYTGIVPIGGFFMGKKYDGTAHMLNARGSNVAKNVVYGDVLEVENLVSRGGKYRVDSKVEYMFVNVGGKYRLVKVYE